MEIDELWAELKVKKWELEIAQASFEAARDALVSRLCNCYRTDENWEDTSVYCVQHMSNTCPYFLGLRKLNP